jgi:putative iron-regulated protein
MAGQRILLGLLLNDPEEEHDCFSDNTHNSHYYDGLGMQNVDPGSYTRTDGSVVSGPSASDLVSAATRLSGLPPERRARSCAYGSG